MRLFTTIFFLLLFTQHVFAEPDCNKKLSALPNHTCQNNSCSPQEISKEVAKNVQKKWKSPAQFIKAKRGYAILVGTMIGSAALTTYLTSHLPPHLTFLSQLVSQLSTLGIYVFGSPIWEPLSSGFRKLAFGVSKEQSKEEIDPENRRLEGVWLKTQESYSLNSQMSRNVINLFITSTRQNFYEAHRAIHSNDETFAADQVAEAAVRMRLLFKDVPPNDPSVTMAIHSAFSRHIKAPHFTEMVRERILNLDPTSSLHTPYYESLLEAWFPKSENEGKTE